MTQIKLAYLVKYKTKDFFFDLPMTASATNAQNSMPTPKMWKLGDTWKKNIIAFKIEKLFQNLKERKKNITVF
jgi:hypothetical protein